MHDKIVVCHFSFSTFRCFICNASPTEMNNLDKIMQKPINENNFCYGLSSLHAWIRCYECLLHIAYNLPFQSWSARTNEQKELRNRRKIEIQNEFRKKTGLLIDIVKQGKGTTNTGNTARRFFRDPSLTAQITGLNVNLIARFGVLLTAIASGKKILKTSFVSYCAETAKKYVELYGWYFMSPTVHKILIHGGDIIDNALVPIGQLSEEAQEANHKLFRSYRLNHARKISRCANNEDVFNSLLLASDPVVTRHRSIISSKHNIAEMSSEVLNLLDLSDDLRL